MTDRRVVVAVISVWILSAFFSFLAFSGFIFIRNIFRRWVYWSLYNNNNLSPDLCNCATAQQSDSSPPSATAD